MCCFSGPVRFVGGTKIFARGLAAEQQLLIYAMNVELDQELAMILPLPVALPAGERDVTFFNLEGEERLFAELGAAFPALGPQPAARSFGPPRQAPKLAVLDVGNYVASFVPCASDFDRLDERFRLPSGFFQALPRYADYGFAVFQLKPAGLSAASKRQQIQPMALSFRRREPRSLFFPTVHVHDGHVPARATFDHALFCQADGVLERTLGWERSTAPLGQHVTGAKSRALLDIAHRGSATSLWGDLENADVWLREPPGVALEDLSGAGDCYTYTVKGTAAYAMGWAGTEREPWTRSASTGLAALCRGMKHGLAELLAARAERWSLAPLDTALAPHFMNGMQLWTGTDYMNGARAEPGGAGHVRFSPFSRLVEPQQVTLGFSRLPSQEEAAAIHAELSRLLDRSVSA